jgi:hypothetical protein
MLKFSYTKIKFFGKWAGSRYEPFIIYPFWGKIGYVFIYLKIKENFHILEF